MNYTIAFKAFLRYNIISKKASGTAHREEIKMKYGVADYGMLVWYGGFYDYEWRINAVKELGFDGIERLYPTSAEQALRRAAYLKANGMSFATCNVQGSPELSIKWSAALGAEYVWAEVVGGRTFEDYMRQVANHAKAAAKYGVKVAVHNHLGQPVEKQENLERLLDECPEVNLLFDVGHLAVAGGDVEYIGNKYYDRIVAYHFKGWQTSDTPDHENWTRRGHFCGLGQGDFFVNNEAVFKNAVSRGFNGWMFIEHDTHLRDPLLDLKESYDIMKKWEREALVK